MRHLWNHVQKGKKNVNNECSFVKFQGTLAPHYMLNLFTILVYLSLKYSLYEIFFTRLKLWKETVLNLSANDCVNIIMVLYYCTEPTLKIKQDWVNLWFVNFTWWRPTKIVNTKWLKNALDVVYVLNIWPYASAFLCKLISWKQQFATNRG